MESSVLDALEKHDPEIAGVVMKRWDTVNDQAGDIPPNKNCRSVKASSTGANIHGPGHFEIWVDNKQTETLPTVMNAGSNPRSKPNADANDCAAAFGTH